MTDSVWTVKVRKLQGSFIEAKSGENWTVIDAETGETVTTNVPIGGYEWRRLAKIARNYVG